MRRKWEAPKRFLGDIAAPQRYHVTMMTERESTYPQHYTATVRTLLRFSLILLVVGLLSGVAFQESAKRFSPEANGLSHADATLHLALVHGHVLVTGVLLPIALAGMLHLARAHGGREVGQRALKIVIYTYLPCMSAAIALMLYKGYHILLSARGGAESLSEIDAALFAGSKAIRHSVYGVSHVGMATGLGVFAWCLWRSLKPRSA